MITNQNKLPYLVQETQQKWLQYLARLIDDQDIKLLETKQGYLAMKAAGGADKYIGPSQDSLDIIYAMAPSQLSAEQKDLDKLNNPVLNERYMRLLAEREQQRLEWDRLLQKEEEAILAQGWQDGDIIQEMGWMLEFTHTYRTETYSDYDLAREAVERNMQKHYCHTVTLSQVRKEVVPIVGHERNYLALKTMVYTNEIFKK
jgi:hypothetical protein